MKNIKKILFIALSGSVMTIADAAVATSTLSTNGTLANTCSTNTTNGGAIAMGDLSVSGPTTGTSVTVTCRTGTIYGMTVTSANGWQLKSGSNLVPYSMVYAGTPPTGVNTAWSGATSSTAALAVTTTASTGQTSAGTIVTYPLSATNTAAGLTLPAGTYTDTVTVTVTYS